MQENKTIEEDVRRWVKYYSQDRVTKDKVGVIVFLSDVGVGNVCLW